MGKRMPFCTTETHLRGVHFAMEDGTRGVLTIGKSALRIVVAGKEYSFERDYSGCPWLLSKRGVPTETPGSRNPFWIGFNRWLREGAKIEGDLCIWTVAEKAKAIRINKRNAIFVHVPNDWREEDGIEYVTKEAPDAL